MNDDTQPASGSRREPPPADPTATPAPPTAYAPAAPRSPRRGRLLLAGGAAGVALVAGAGGFALGHATADDGRDGGPARVGPGPDRHGPGGFPGDRGGDSQDDGTDSSGTEGS